MFNTREQASDKKQALTQCCLQGRGERMEKDTTCKHTSRKAGTAILTSDK